MEMFILSLWFLFNVMVGIMEYPMYTDQVEFSNEKNLIIRKIIIPIFKFIMAVPIAIFFTTYEFNNEIFINAFGLYFIGMIFHKGVFYQLRRYNKRDYYRKCFHFFSHSNNPVFYINSFPIIDIYAIGRILVTLMGYSILFVEFN